MAPEKLTLKPVTKELLFKSSEANTNFDVFNYHGTTNQEKTLGSLFLVGHVKYDEEDMSYLISLVSSLAKREYYSSESIQEQNPKAAFEHTLKKLNEVLEEFFNTKKFKLNIGLAAIAGEMIYISRLGKFKVALARNNEYIDILNNLMLFNKDTEHETQFSNIISGRIQSGDKIFAYFPARSITAREKQINPILIKSDQAEFSDKIASLATNPNFSCCGIHLTIQQNKEIPVKTPSAYQNMISKEAPATLAQADMTIENKIAEAASEKETIKEIAEPGMESEDQEVMPTTIPAELSMNKRPNAFYSAAGQLNKLRSLSRFSARAKLTAFLILGGIIIIPLVAWTVYRNIDDTTSAAYTQADDNIKLAESKLRDNDLKGAGAFLEAALTALVTIDTEQAQAMRSDIDQRLDSIYHISDQKPELVTDADQSIFESVVPKTLQEKVADSSAALYQDNLYVLSDDTTVMKYADATKGGTKETKWGDLESPTIAIAVDGNLYAISSDGVITKYFKGKKESSSSLGLSFDSNARLFTYKDNPNIYISDISNKRVYLINKESLSLSATYKLDSVGDIQKLSISSDNIIWILSADNKVWNIH